MTERPGKGDSHGPRPDGPNGPVRPYPQPPPAPAPPSGPPKTR